MRRFVADAISARVHRTMMCEVALPSGLDLVNTVRNAAMLSRSAYGNVMLSTGRNYNSHHLAHLPMQTWYLNQVSPHPILLPAFFEN